MSRYAIITPKAGAEPPANTRRGWAFQHDSAWHPIGPDRAYPEAVAEHARAFFTHTPVDGGEPECCVEIRYHEGALALSPVAAHACPMEGCGERFTDVSAFGAHVKACALSGGKKPNDAKGEA